MQWSSHGWIAQSHSSNYDWKSSGHWIHCVDIATELTTTLVLQDSLRRPAAAFVPLVTRLRVVCKLLVAASSCISVGFRPQEQRSFWSSFWHPCHSPDHLQGPQARIPKNCCGDCCGNCRGNSGCWGGVLGKLPRRLPGTALALRSRETAVPLAVSAAVPPAVPPASRISPAVSAAGQQFWGIQAWGPCRWSGEW